MPFDFDNKQFSSKPSHGGFDWSNSGSFGGNTGTVQSGFEADASNVQTSFSNSFQVIDPFQAPSTDNLPTDIGQFPSVYGSQGLPTRHSARSRRTSKPVPWRTIIIVGGIVLALLLCIIFQRQITDFIKLVLGWVVTIAVIFVILRILLHHRIW